MSGKFITFEGGEGAGKSTQIRCLADRLRAGGLTVTLTREPGGTPTAEAIRRLLLSGIGEQFGAEGEAIFFAAARADHVDRVIRPALAAGEWVLCDRFTDSTHVYQGATGGADETLLEALDRVAVGRTRPDLTLILDVSASIGMARVMARPESAGTPDRFEREDMAKHERRRESYLDIAIREPMRCVLIDAEKSEDEVAAEVWQAVASRFMNLAA
jgi:dTMP kinase